MQQNPSKSLKSISIFMIILGAIGFLINLFTIASMVDYFGYLLGSAGIIGYLTVFMLIISLVGTILMFTAGILGVKNCLNPEKMSACITLGIIIVIIRVVDLVFAFVAMIGGEFDFPTLIGAAIGILIPIAYISIAKKVKKMVFAPMNAPMGNPVGQPPYGQQGQPYGQNPYQQNQTEQPYGQQIDPNNAQVNMPVQQPQSNDQNQSTPPTE